MMREPIRLACESLRKDGGKNMGQCVELFALASDEDEARAYCEALLAQTNGIQNADGAQK